MCGGTIEFEPGATVGVCDSCGTRQTLPRLDDDKKTNLYDRANHFRRNNDFDKAMAIYEQILNEDNTDAEAYWSLVLCRYGIEYVEDPQSHKRIPTVNRAQFTSVFADEDYKSALQYADSYQRSIYEEEARAIDDIQKGILAISQREEPFDIFICYKETDANGRRTQDSVLATDLYHQLTQEGFKVFFSRITLEDKLGIAYEPYIFAALNSAKVMVALGTKPEYFNAVWVKNEWSRYLALVKKSGGKKVLIPAYRDMDPYDLPEEFSHLQAQDMSKLGFMQDLIRGIKKITAATDTPTATIKETIVSDSTVHIAPLLKRAFMFLEDGNWEEADTYCEKVLDQDPENAQAYLGKLMAELRVRRQEELQNCQQPFNANNNYRKAVRFGGDRMSSVLNGYITQINERNENARLTGIYYSAVNAMSAANSETEFKSVAETYRTISGWKDADEQIAACQRKIEEIKAANAKAESDRLKRLLAREEKKRKAKRIAKIVTPIVACSTAFFILLGTVIIPTRKYNAAMKLKDTGKYTEAINAFRALNGYRDSAAQIEKCIKAEALKNPKVGDTIYWGAYEQDNDTSNGKEIIEWLVLAIDGNKALVISKYALDCQKYNVYRADVTWEKCSLRTWMNGTFLNSAFSADEQAKILSAAVFADENPTYSTDPGDATTDKMFLLSITEAEKYFTTDASRKCTPTDYAKAQGADASSSDPFCWWWLRSPGRDQRSAAVVPSFGVILDSGFDVDDYPFFGVRPAMWIDLDA